MSLGNMRDDEIAAQAAKIRLKSVLTAEDREILAAEHEIIMRSASRGAAVAIMARNFSHGKGSNVKPK
jgi:hypothetical protein